MRENTAKRTLKAGGAVLSITLTFVHAGLAEFLGRLGYDPIVLDSEHGPLVDDRVEEFARACDVARVTPVLRIAFNAASDAMIQRYMNIGIQGLHIPQIQSADQARAVVDAATFRPLGKRGIGTYRATDFGATLGEWTDFRSRSNEETLVKVSIEDAEGFAALEEIARVPGIDVISFGMNDLADSMGLPGQRDHPKLLKAVDEAIAVIRGAGKIPGLTTTSVASVKTCYDRGGRYLTTSVARILMHGSSDYLGAVRSLAAG